MSEALEYLMKARPEAMGHYFAFAKEAGRHLDPKTKALISVITKVAVQTDRGFRQYLKRALSQGVSAQEILDGLLMAFPVLGLSKIVWAVDILIELQLPEFDLTALTPQSEWRPVARFESVPQGGSTLPWEDRVLFVYREAEAVRVFDSRCPHQATSIPAAALVGGEITCPKHHWCFELRTGRCIRNGDRPLRELESKLEAGDLLVRC